MRTELFDYDLPPERIAQTPIPRGESRLLVLHKDNGRIEHRRFPDLLDYLRAGDTLVLNETRVTARRLQARRDNGNEAEVLLLHPVAETGWEALVRPGKSLRPGKTLTVSGLPAVAAETTAQIVATTPEGGRLLEFTDRATRDALATWGVTPLPPYIHAPLPAEQEERYQTVYATQGGSAAAPTAGLHFTPELLARAEQQGVALARVTLHVGVGTFRPVRTENIEEHEMHAETFLLSEAAARIINATTGRIIAVGTTSVRTLESAAHQEEGVQVFRYSGVQDNRNPGNREQGSEDRANHPTTQLPNYPTPCRVHPMAGETYLFIAPGYRFRAVDGLVTNFHLPCSTLLMLVCALAGREATLRAYEEAVRQEYRFFSFGDAMLIV